MESGWITSKTSQNKAQNSSKNKKEQFWQNDQTFSDAHKWMMRVAVRRHWRRLSLVVLDRERHWMKKAGLGVADGEAHAGTRAGSVC